MYHYWNRPKWARTLHTAHLMSFLTILTIFQASQSETVTNQFGFAGKEIFPIDHLLGHLRSADLDGDGFQDLLIVNSLRSKITLLFNQTGQTNLTQKSSISEKDEINELPPDARFQIKSIASEKRISSIAVADLNGDQLPDFAYYGDPRDLVVQYNEGDRVWSAPKHWPLADGLLNPNALISGDLNGDGRTDLFLLAENHVYWLKQESDHSLGEPSRIPYSGTVQAVQILDIQGDGLEDLLLVNWDSSNPFRFRLQTSKGQLGPEIHSALPPIRSYWADDLDDDSKTEVITIAHKSGRAQISHFVQEETSAQSLRWEKEQFELLPLNRTTKSERGMAFADIDGDGLSDLLVAEPESGQITSHLQHADGSFAAPKTFPTLSGISELRVADWDGDGHPDIFMLSHDERQIGVTRYESNGRIPFPTLLPVVGRPLRMDVGIIKHGKNPSVTVVADEEGKRSIQTISHSGESQNQELNAKFRSNPRSLMIVDLDQDGLNDLIVLIPYARIKVLIQTAEGGFNEQDIAQPGGSTDLPWLSTADVDGDGKDELLMAQKNFLRAVMVEPTKAKSEDGQGAWAFTVKEQINGAASNSRITAAAALRGKDQDSVSLFLLDAEHKVLTLSERDDTGVWQVTRSLPLPVSDFSRLTGMTYGKTKKKCVALLGINALARISFQGRKWKLAELDDYESPIKNAYLHDVISGDLNNDGRKDLVFLETGKNYLDIVTFEKPHRLVPANRWQVFEQRSFRSRRITIAEPREALIADFTGDGKNDLVVLVHDRIILYPQE